MSGWLNYDDVLGQLRAVGLDIDSLKVGTPSPVRCREINGDREKRCWYWLSDIELTSSSSGRGLYITGAWGIFRGNERIKGKVDLKLTKRRIEITAEQREAMKVRQAEATKRAKAIRDAEIKRAAAAAQKAWAVYVPDGESDYLVKKQVGAHGIRFSPSANGTFAVPMADGAGRIWGLQIIRAGRNTRRQLQKQYWPKGLNKVGHYHMIGKPLASAVILVCEGYATGASLHEATGLPVAVAFDAGNLVHVARSLHENYRTAQVLICADDDYQQKCKACGKLTPVDSPACAHCGADHGCQNPGVEAAKAAAHAVGGAWVAPAWPFDRAGSKLTDFNDLATHAEGGAQHVTARIADAIRAAGWGESGVGTPPPAAPGGGGGAERPRAASVMAVGDLVDRFIPIDDGTGKSVFDMWTRKIVLRTQMESLLPAGARMDDVKRHPTWINRGAYYIENVGFDPTERDPKVLLNTWRGWPTTPRSGDCKRALDLLRYLCSNEQEAVADELYDWVLKWLAYPIQNPGAKMRTSILIHGPQGTGKSILMESIAKIYGEYGHVIDHGAIEDKFNSDWCMRKLFVIADEVVAMQEKHQLKNQLKGLITGKVIRINPKNLPAYSENNLLNVVFLSNEHQALVLEADDRRHCVIWTPPALSKPEYTALSQVLDNGGIEALHQFLLEVDLGDFNEWTLPPETKAKDDLRVLGMNSVQLFLREWTTLELETPGGKVVPFCPCLGSQLYETYQAWCRRTVARDIGMKIFMSYVTKRPGWEGGKSQPTWDNFQNRRVKNRKMIVPNPDEMLRALDHDATGCIERLQRDQFESKRDWLTAGFFAFSDAIRVTDPGGDW